MEFTKIFRSLRKVVRVRIGEQYIHIQFEASIGYALLQGRREGAGVESHKHFRSAVESEKYIKYELVKRLSRKCNRPFYYISFCFHFVL